MQIRSIGIGESALETELRPLFDQHEQLAVAYCAHQGQVDCRISFPESAEREEELHQIGEECRRLLGADFLGFGHDSLPEIVLNSLKDHNASLALAESFTGGQIANAITDIPGASSVFNGSIVCYSDEVKINVLGVPEEMIRKNTAVSEPVAEAMALRAAKRLNSDYAISATGYAGPDGGTEETPVGTVFLGLHSTGGTEVHRYRWKIGRLAIKRCALHTLWISSVESLSAINRFYVFRTRVSMTKSVIDRLGRPIRDLRISLCDQCNFRCSYCMPKEVFGPEYTFLPKELLK